MLSYCLKSKNNNENVNPKVLKTKYGKTVLSSKMCYMWWKKIKIYKKTRSK